MSILDILNVPCPHCGQAMPGDMVLDPEQPFAVLYWARSSGLQRARWFVYIQAPSAELAQRQEAYYKSRAAKGALVWRGTTAEAQRLLDGGQPSLAKLVDGADGQQQLELTP
jgi:hypothetical protein